MQNQTPTKLWNKVPEITLYFWVIKILATTVGETGADFLIFNLHLGLSLTSAIMGLLLVGITSIQILSKRYTPWLYWLAVVLISIVGTLLTDNMTDNFNVPLYVSTTVFSLCLAVTFIIWYLKEKTLSIHSIFTKRREIFYWLAILFTFALGTAAGDLTAEQMGLGYLTSATIYAGLIALVAAGHYLLKLNPILTFWAAYILTRPFGASCGDYLSQPHKYGGLGLGTISTSFVFLGIITGLIVFLSWRANQKAVH